MPVLVMTPEEFAELPWHARQRAILHQLRAQREDPTPTQIARAEDVIAWAEGEREYARRALVALPPNPDASAHRRQLAEATRRRRAS